MRKLVFAINISLDGLADHTVAIADDELHDFYTRWMDSIDTVLFGRITYQLMESFWPHAPEDPDSTRSMIAFAHQINSVRKIVFSNTLREVTWNNTSLVRGHTLKEIKRLKQGTGKSRAIGGISLIQACMSHKLIDEYWLLVQPLIWGKGRRLFDGVTSRIDHKLMDTTTFKSGVVVLHYLPVWETNREEQP